MLSLGLLNRQQADCEGERSELFMKRQIVEKLNNSLRNFESEADVVYILTRIGKILEIDEKKQDYPVINFYRNWSVHKQINNVGNVRH